MHVQVSVREGGERERREKKKKKKKKKVLRKRPNRQYAAIHCLELVIRKLKLVSINVSYEVCVFSKPFLLINKVQMARDR